jgi:hypothetical protein
LTFDATHISIGYMFGHIDLLLLIERTGVYRMECGWQVVIRADWVDPTPQQPHGLDYAIILQDERGYRIFGFDNAHAYDGAAEDDRWDHEHRVARPGQRFRYDFSSAGDLITHFFEKLDGHCAGQGVSSNFIMDDDHG